MGLWMVCIGVTAAVARVCIEWTFRLPSAWAIKNLSAVQATLVVGRYKILRFLATNAAGISIPSWLKGGTVGGKAMGGTP